MPGMTGYELLKKVKVYVRRQESKNLQKKCLTLLTKEIKAMKEDSKLIRTDKEEQANKAAEPVGTALRSDVSVLGYDIDNWPGMPIVGPSDLEELNARIDQAEQEMNEENGYSWEEVMMDAHAIVNRYETAVY